MLEIEALAALLHQLATPDMPPKALIAAVREQYPKATKKQIVRAAFYALTHAQTGDREQGQLLHAFALSERADNEEEALVSRAVRKKARRKEDGKQSAAPVAAVP